MLSVTRRSANKRPLHRPAETPISFFIRNQPTTPLDSRAGSMSFGGGHGGRKDSFKVGHVQITDKQVPSAMKMIKVWKLLYGYAFSASVAAAGSVGGPRVRCVCVWTGGDQPAIAVVRSSIRAGNCAAHRGFACRTTACADRGPSRSSQRPRGGVVEQFSLYAPGPGFPGS